MKYCLFMGPFILSGLNGWDLGASVSYKSWRQNEEKIRPNLTVDTYAWKGPHDSSLAWCHRLPNTTQQRTSLFVTLPMPRVSTFVPVVSFLSSPPQFNILLILRTCKWACGPFKAHTIPSHFISKGGNFPCKRVSSRGLSYIGPRR